MKNMTWRHCLILALAFWPAANQASTLSATNDIQIYPGGNIDLQTGQTPGNLEAKQPPLITGGDIQILPREGIKIQTGQTPINSGLISPLTIVLPTEPTFLAVQQAQALPKLVIILIFKCWLWCLLRMLAPTNYCWALVSIHKSAVRAPRSF